MTDTEARARAEFEKVMGSKRRFWHFNRRVDGKGLHEDYEDGWVESAWQSWLAAWNARGAGDDSNLREAQFTAQSVYLSAVKGRQYFRKAFAAECQQRMKLEEMLRRIVVADDAAVKELKAMGIHPSDEVSSLTEEARELLREPAPRHDCRAVNPEPPLTSDEAMAAMKASLTQPAPDDKGNYDDRADAERFRWLLEFHSHNGRCIDWTVAALPDEGDESDIRALIDAERDGSEAKS